MQPLKYACVYVGNHMIVEEPANGCPNIVLIWWFYRAQSLELGHSQVGGLTLEVAVEFETLAFDDDDDDDGKAGMAISSRKYFTF